MLGNRNRSHLLPRRWASPEAGCPSDSPRRRARLHLEELEGRWAPAISISIVGGVLTVDSDNSGNTIAIDHNAATGVTTVNVADFPDSLFTGIIINGGAGHDTDNLLATPAVPTTVNNAADATVTVGKAGSVQGLLGPLSIQDARGRNTLTVDDSADRLAHTVTLQTITSFGRLGGLAPAPIEYKYVDTASLTVKTSRGLDTVNVLGTGVFTTLIGEANETVNVGNNGLLSDIDGPLTVTNPPAFTALNVNSSAERRVGDVTLGVSGGVGFINEDLAPQPIHYNQADVSAVTVTGPAGGGVYTVTNTVTNATNPLTTLNLGNALLATVNVQATTGPLTVTTSGGTDVFNVGFSGSVQGLRGTLTLINAGRCAPPPVPCVTTTLEDGNDFTGRNVIVNDTSVVGLAPAVINYQGETELTILSGDGPNSFTINGNSGSGRFGTELHHFGPEADTVNVRATTGPVVIASAFPVATTIGSLAPGLGGTLANIHGQVESIQSGATSPLIVDDSGDATARNVMIGGGEFGGEITGLAPATITVVSTQAVTINGGHGGNSFTVFGDPHASLLTLNTGTGADTVNVQSTTGPVTVNGQSGADTVNLGNTSAGTAGIRGTVTVENPSFFTAVNVNDQANPSATRATLSVAGTTGTVSGLGNPSSPFTLHYLTTDVSSLTINGGGHGNTYAVLSTASFPVTLHTGGGDDTVNVGDAANTLDGIRGPLTVDGQAGFDTLNMNDQGETTAHHYSETATMLVRSPGGPTITFLDIERPVLTIRSNGMGPTNDVVDVLGTAAGAAAEVDASGGATVNVGNEAGTLDDLQGPLSVVGADGSVALNVNDQGSAAGQNYAIGDSNVDRSGAAEITYAGVAALALSAGAGGNQIDVDGLPFGTPATVNAGAGGDLIRMRGGPVNAPLTLNGRGNTRLGYAAYTTPVLVDVPAGQATDVKGGFSGLSDLTGGQGLNVLVGDGTQELHGGPGRNLLISGGGTAALTGGGAGDILVGGTTAYDRDPAALQAILDYWALSGDDYATRVANLRAGNGVPPLDNGEVSGERTVFDGGAANTLTGHGDEAAGVLNLFYVTRAGVVTDRQPSEQVVDIEAGGPSGPADGPGPRAGAPAGGPAAPAGRAEAGGAPPPAGQAPLPSGARALAALAAGSAAGSGQPSDPNGAWPGGGLDRSAGGVG